MKKKIYSVMTFLIATVLLAACSSVNSGKGDYFGYNNHPKYQGEQINDNQSENDNWENPLNENYQNKDNFTVVYYSNNMPPAYIPVVVPWYDYRYNWYNDPFSSFYFGVGYYPYPIYSWYSPYYSYYPYRYNPYMFGGGCCWDWYPYYGHYSNRQPKTKRSYTIRNFGPHRGNYNSSGTPYAGGSSSQSGRAAARTNDSKSSVKSPIKVNLTDTRIKYKPASKGSFSNFPSRSKNRNIGKKSKIKYDKNSTTRSPIGNTSGFGSGSKNSSRPSGSSRGSGGGSRSSGGSKSSSSRSSGRGR